jgi:hypothetical protein
VKATRENSEVSSQQSATTSVSRSVPLGGVEKRADNRRHFMAALRYGIRVETPGEFLTAFKARRG